MVTIHHQQIAGRKSFPLEPAHVTMRDGCAYTGDSRSAMYEAIAKGEVEAVKNGPRTLLVFESLKKRVASRPPAVIGAGSKPTWMKTCCPMVAHRVSACAYT